MLRIVAVQQVRWGPVLVWLGALVYAALTVGTIIQAYGARRSWALLVDDENRQP